jgi:SAM-dependent methyltransferase
LHEILAALSADALVLDLGSGSGSFARNCTRARVVRVGLRFDACEPGLPVAADAARLPFRAAVFDAAIASHSLEHFAEPVSALKEVGRVLKPGAALFVAVPDASTFTDKLYRWLGRGGVHTNLFRDREEVSRLISSNTGLPEAGSRLLHTGLSFLNRKAARHPLPKRVLAVGGGYETGLRAATFIFRVVDRLFSTRLSVYGWAMYFGSVPPIDTTAWSNVCVRCGSGHPARSLEASGSVNRRLGFRYYRCPGCWAVNLFTRDCCILHQK